MAIEEAVLELTETMKELIETLKTEKQFKAEPENKEEPQASKQETYQPELEEVRSSLIRLKEATDHETAKAVLKSFGVQKVQDLAEKDYKRCIELCQKEAA